VAGEFLSAPYQAAADCGDIRDRDCDGIPDVVEHSLLAHFRPYYRFSRDHGSVETFRPIDVVKYLRLSQVDGTGKESEKILLSNLFLRNNLDALLALQVNDHDRYCSEGSNHQWRCSSNVMDNFRRTDYHINPDNDAGRRGAEWPSVRSFGDIGLYGHVVPVRLASAEAYDRNHIPSSADSNLPLFYKIEYWQFFGYSSNDQPQDIGDHEGDWDTVQLIVKPANPRSNTPGQLMSVLYYAHGKEMRFDMSAATNESAFFEERKVQEYRGVNYNLPVPDLKDDGAEDKARNYVLQMVKDSDTSDYSHPVVFIEHGSHEFWPSPYWSYSRAQKHTGDDIEFLSAPPPNLGEVEHPLTETSAALFVLRFNGYWGTYSRGFGPQFPNNPPPGPPLHFEWTWPMDSAIRWQLRGIEY